jgi:hypothetical protein
MTQLTVKQRLARQKLQLRPLLAFPFVPKNTTAGFSSGRFTHKILFSHSPDGPPTTRREDNPEADSCQSPVLGTRRNGRATNQRKLQHDRP